MKPKLAILTIVCLAALLLGACKGASPTATVLDGLRPSPTPPTPTTVLRPSPTPTPEPVESVTIYYEEAAQFELISSTGRRILIDIMNYTTLTKPATDQDILLTTHYHDDHYFKPYVDAFPGQKLTVEVGEIRLPDVTITGIASVHNSNEQMKPKDGTNYIYIIDMAGLRIVHFGDIGQDALTEEQLTALGHVDVALMQIDNSYSNMNITNKKGFKLMDQVKPTLIIPTHQSLSTAEEATKVWVGTAARKTSITISKDQLPSQTTVVFMGMLASSYQKIYSLPWFGE
jgi:L-ascorbate metabolism protein UlaG (beta-lactamase superfamily)